MGFIKDLFNGFGIKDEPVFTSRSQSFYGHGTYGGFQNSLDNLFTGNLDYAREKELQQISNAFSASEADSF